MFKGRHFEPEVIIVSVRWYLKYKLSTADISEMMAERGISVDPSTIWRWVKRYAPDFEKKWQRFASLIGPSWRVDETYIKVKGKQTYLYRGVDKRGRSVVSHLSRRRNVKAMKRARCMGESPRPSRWTDIKLPIGRFENFLKNHDDENPLRSDRQSISIILSSKIIVRSNRAPVPCWVSRISRRRGSRLRALSCCIAFAKGNSISNTSASSVKRSRKYGTRYSPHKHRRHQDSSRSHFLKFAREPRTPLCP